MSAIAPFAEIPGGDSYNWVIAPAGRCVSLIAEETAMASLIQRGIIALANQCTLLESARRELTRAGQPQNDIAKLIAAQASLEKAAKDVVAVDFNPINIHGIIGLWVAIEVAVEDTAVLILLRDSGASALAQSAGLKLPIPSNDLLETSRRTYRRLAGRCKTTL